MTDNVVGLDEIRAERQKQAEAAEAERMKDVVMLSFIITGDGIVRVAAPHPDIPADTAKIGLTLLESVRGVLEKAAKGETSVAV